MGNLSRDLDRHFFLAGSPGPLRRLRIVMSTPGIWSTIDYRYGRWLLLRRSWVFPRVLGWIRLPFHVLTEALSGISIPDTARIGPGLYIGHFGGVILNSATIMGENCNLNHDVTIGRGGRGENKGVPVIGDRAYFGPGSRIFGKIRIGDDVAVGANAVVTCDLPDRSVAVGIPAKVISEKGSFDFVNYRGMPQRDDL